MYYLCSENKGADQLRGYCEADLRLCFRICKKPVFSWRGSNHCHYKEFKICKNAEMTILCLILHCKNAETTILLSFLHFYSVESYIFCYFFSPIQICFRLNKKIFFSNFYFFPSSDLNTCILRKKIRKPSIKKNKA